MREERRLGVLERSNATPMAPSIADMKRPGR